MVVPSSGAAGHGIRLPDPDPESEDSLPPRSALSSSMTAPFGSFVQFLSSQNPDILSSFGDTSGPAAAALGAPPSVTPSTPLLPSVRGGGGGEFGSGLRSLPHALRVVGACEVAGPQRQDRRPCTLGDSPCACLHHTRGGSV